MSEPEKVQPAKQSLLDLHVMYPNFLVLLWTVIATMHIVVAITGPDIIPPFWNGLVIGMFGVLALSELGLRWRVRKFGRV